MEELSQQINQAWSNGDKDETIRLLKIGIEQGDINCIWQLYQVLKSDNLEEALEWLEKLHNETEYKVWEELNNLYIELNRGEANRILINNWIEAEPKNIIPKIQLANLYAKQELYDLSDELYSDILSIASPNRKANIIYNWGCDLMDRLDYTGAIILFKESLELGNTQAAWNLGLCYLYTGDIKGLTGWQTRFTRNAKDTPKMPELPIPYWDGRNLGIIRDKRVLVLNEQGFGDEFMFLNSYDSLKLAKDVVVQVYEETLPAIDKLFNIQNIKFMTERSLSLEYVLTFDYWTISGEVWAGRLESGELPLLNNEYINKESNKVGIVWEPNRKSANWDDRKINPHKLVEFIGTSFTDIQLWNLNPAVDLPNNIIGENKNPQNWGETVDMLKDLKCLFTCDTGIAHLAILMGIKTYLILPERSDWRWSFYTPDRVKNLTILTKDYIYESTKTNKTSNY